MADIVQKRNGHLYCNDCRLVWCRHIELVIKENEDWKLIWEDNTTFVLMIPYIPDIIWAVVELGEPTQVGSRPVYLLHPESSVTTGVVLGQIFPGEGRAVIRDLLHNWFESQLRDPMSGKFLVLTCPRATHKYQEEMKFKNNLKDPKKKWIEYWSFYWYQCCSSCKEIENSISDLVPEKV